MRRVHARYEYLNGHGKFVRVPRFIWRFLDRGRCRVTFS